MHRGISLYATIKRFISGVVGLFIPAFFFFFQCDTYPFVNKAFSNRFFFISKAFTCIVVMCFIVVYEASAVTPAGTVISNQAQASFNMGGGAVDQDSNIDQFTVLSINTADVIFSSSPTSLFAGETVTMDLSITNTGGNALESSRLQVQLPATGTVVTSDGGYPAQITGNTATVSLPDIAFGANLTFKLYIQLPTTLSGGSVNIPLEYWANNTLISTASADPVVKARTEADTDLMFYDSGGSGLTMQVPVTEYDSGGGIFVVLPPPPVPGSAALVTDNPLALGSSDSFRSGQTMFLEVLDADQNKDDSVIDTIVIDVSIGPKGSQSSSDSERLRLKETGVNTGIFLGYITTIRGGGTNDNDGSLGAEANNQIKMVYQDQDDTADSITTIVLVDPYGVVFDTTTGKVLNGVTVDLINTDTGLPATVFGDDGVSTFPSSMVTGGTVTDSGGTKYVMIEGGYRFPLIPPGNYRLDVTLPAGSGHVVPSTVSTDAIQNLPGAPFAINLGSRGEVFPIVAGPALNIDIPADLITTHIYLRKSASKSTVASGDYLQYQVSLENTSALNPLVALQLTDVLPHGFRYEKGSAKRDGVAIADPAIASDGRTLTFNMGNFAASESATVSYVTRVGAVRQKEATNTAYATADGGLATSNTATAKVKIKEEFMRSHAVLLGRVAVKDIAPDAEADGGISGVRIFMEDGTYVLTDERGLYHFEGVKPGTHVVQLDLDTLPAQYMISEPGPDAHVSEGGFSRFVDLQGGSLWRVDFDLSLKATPKGKVSLGMNTHVTADQTQQHYEIELDASVVPVKNARLMIMLPEGAKYHSGSSSVNDSAITDPKDPSSMLTFRLGDLSADQKNRIKFSVDIDPNKAGEKLISKAMVMVNTPTKNNLKIDPIENVLMLKKDNKAASQKTGTSSVETLGTRPGQAVQSADQATEDKKMDQQYDAVWLQQQQPGFDWVFPQEGDLPAIPSIHIGVKHSPQEKVAVILNGEPVPALNFEYTRKNKERTVAFSLWRGVDIIEGDNRLDVLVTDKEGVEVRRESRIIHYSGPPVRAEFVPERSMLVADGKSPPAIAVYLTDKDGAPAREDSLGAYHVSSPYRAKSTTDFNTEQLAGAAAERHTYKVGKDGVALIYLEPTAESGDVTVTLPLSNGDHEIAATLQPHARDWILVGLAEGSVGYNTISGNAEPLSGAEADEHLYEDDRIAFYAKGKIKGEWLLTIAYDNTKEKTNSLHQTIDPGTYYTMYGDNATQRNDAVSREKLYIKIEKDDFYAMFGDYETGLTKTKLAPYSRSLTGLKSRYRDETYEVIVFASESNHGFVKDEIRGNGITGPYALSRSDLVMNSEKVVIEVRDRFRSEIIISSQEMTRHTDYNINYETGTITFREPVFNRDEDLNPTFIVVKYESFDESDRKLTYGGRVQMKMSEELTLGVTHVNEGRVGAKAKLTGVDATYKFNENTMLHVEVAETDSSDNENSAKGDAYLAEVDHRNGDLSVRGYVQEQKGAFGVGQTNGSESGTRKVGVDGGYKITDDLRVNVSAYRDTNLETKAIRDHVDTKATYTMDKLQLNGGVKAVTDKLGDGTKKRSRLLTAGAVYAMLDNKLRLKAEHEMSLSSKKSVDFPSRTRVGFDYAFTDKTALFGEHEWTTGENIKTQITSVGIKQKLWTDAESFTTLSRKYTADVSETATMTSGFRQRYKLNDQWSFDGGTERSVTLSDRTLTPFNTNVPSSSASTNDFSAYSIGANYTPGDWIWNGRLELRHSDTEDAWGVATSAQSKPSNDLGLMASLTVNGSKSTTGTKTLNSDLRLGLAYRPANTKWIVLDKLDLIHNKSTGTDFDSSEWNVINNLNANYRHSGLWQSSLQYAFKLAQDTIDKKKYSGYTDLVGIESRYRFSGRWDVGGRASVLHAWDINQFDFSSGLSLGYRFNKDIWVSAGYNFIGFRDEDFTGSDFTSKGVYVQFRMKLDQTSMDSAMDWLEE